MVDNELRGTDDMRAVGFDLGDTLGEYVGVPLSWEPEYPAALSAVASVCGCELTPESLRSGTGVLLRYNTRVTPRPDLREAGITTFPSSSVATPSWSLNASALFP